MQSIFLDGMRRGWAPWQPNMKFQTKSIGAQRIFSWANVIIQQICVVLVASSCVYSKIAPMKMVWNAVKLKKNTFTLNACTSFCVVSFILFVSFFVVFTFCLYAMHAMKRGIRQSRRIIKQHTKKNNDKS